MSQVFFEELGLTKPDAFLGIGSGSPVKQTGDAIMKFGDEFASSEPDCVLVEGDTNTVLAGAVAATKLRIPIGHVEAGLRSYDLRMPEEYNRRLTDHISDFLFAPTAESARILKGEHVWGKIHKTGNTVIDATVTYLPKAQRRSKVLKGLPWERYALATLHRAENVDDKATLANMVKVLTDCPVPIVLPLHPRTDKMLKEHSLKDKVTSSKNIHLIPPAGYFDMLVLMKNAEFILTDSGGIQEEASSPVMRKRVFVMRLNTERPEAVKAGYCIVVGTDATRVLREVRAYVKDPKVRFAPCPYGKGDAAERTVRALKADL
jgi:UDP-N-acetylglucosamine 2-epimerase (non-hydrolysing)